MSCDCCDSLRCVPNPVQSLAVSPASSDGATVSWLAPVHDPGTEEVDYYILAIEDMDGKELYNETLDSSETSFDLDRQLFIRIGTEYRIIVHAMYDSCTGTTQTSAVLKLCNESEFLAKHVNLSDDKTSGFASGTIAIAIDEERTIIVGCSGEVELTLLIPCKDKMKGELYVDGVQVLYLKTGETTCTTTYTYAPSFPGEEVIWKVYKDVSCDFSEPVISSCSYGKPEVTVMIPGCTDRNFANWNPSANVDDGSCVSKVFGCTHKLALNYDPLANVDNGTCVMPVSGCTDPDALNYTPGANVDNGSCIPKVLGCMDPASTNYNPLANVSDGTCIIKVMGCTDPNSLNFNSLANTDDGSCIAKVYGCMDPTATNYNSQANTENGSCLYRVPGCMDPLALNYNPGATVDDGNCAYPSCHYGMGEVVVVDGVLTVDENTEINIFFDASGSMDQTLPKLLMMKETILKPCLMPFFNGDGALYDAKVQIIGGTYDFFGNTITGRTWTSERSLGGTYLAQGAILQREGSDGTVTKVINIVFQDEANASYHASLTSFNPETEAPSEKFQQDINALRALYNSKPEDYFRSVIFQVKGSNAWASFLSAIENGSGLYTGPNSLADLSNQIKIKYNVTNGSEPDYYANQIVTALNELGYSIPSC